ncbi:hypothetical protein Rhopal_005685-T1 [Rhodotorula paludigena]|uniref:Uncharacterized protein n=1 Tax=Rhodotorula paludigena TaxID=86838 RepID=A0AAV5GRW9_9BASI|nr:hypothetical protein Rhopal_005685-T1 [Rhodotorula paludigena]
MRNMGQSPSELPRAASPRPSVFPSGLAGPSIPPPSLVPQAGDCSAEAQHVSGADSLVSPAGGASSADSPATKKRALASLDSAPGGASVTKAVPVASSGTVISKQVSRLHEDVGGKLNSIIKKLEERAALEGPQDSLSREVNEMSSILKNLSSAMAKLPDSTSSVSAVISASTIKQSEALREIAAEQKNEVTKSYQDLFIALSSGHKQLRDEMTVALASLVSEALNNATSSADKQRAKVEELVVQRDSALSAVTLKDKELKLLEQRVATIEGENICMGTKLRSKDYEIVKIAAESEDEIFSLKTFVSALQDELDETRTEVVELCAEKDALTSKMMRREEEHNVEKRELEAQISARNDALLEKVKKAREHEAAHEASQARIALLEGVRNDLQTELAQARIERNTAHSAARSVEGAVKQQQDILAGEQREVTRLRRERDIAEDDASYYRAGRDRARKKNEELEAQKKELEQRVASLESALEQSRRDLALLGGGTSSSGLS